MRGIVSPMTVLVCCVQKLSLASPIAGIPRANLALRRSAWTSSRAPEAKADWPIRKRALVMECKARMSAKALSDLRQSNARVTAGSVIPPMRYSSDASRHSKKGIAALSVSTGQAALHYAVLNAQFGNNIVSVPQLYGTTHTLFAHLCLALV
jgi:hypothetical protein